MTTKKDFEATYNSWMSEVIRAMEEARDNVLSNQVIDLENAYGNNLDVFPLLAAVLEKEVHYFLFGGSDYQKQREMLQKRDAYKGNLSVWHKEYPNYHKKI